MRRLWELARQESRLILLGTLFLALGSLAGLAYPQAFRVIIDDLELADSALLKRDVLIMVAIVAVQALAISLRMYTFTVAGERIVARLRQRLYARVMEQEVAFFDERRTGELVSRLASDTTVLQSTVTVNASMALRNVLLLVGGLALMFRTSPQLTLVMLGVVPPIAIGAVLVGKRIQRLSRLSQDALASSGAVAEETLSGLRTVRSFTREAAEGERYGSAVWTSFDLARQRMKGVATFVGVSYFASFAALGAILWLGLERVMQGTLTSGELTQFILYGFTVGFAMGGVGEIWAELMKARGASGRVFDLLDRDTAMPLSGGARPASVGGRIELRDVSFAYPTRPDVKALHSVDLVVDAGEVVALVGPSGAGKSTVAALIPRFYDPQAGALLLDGRDLRELDPSWLREQIGSVAQEPTLFSTSIAENIRYGRLGASDADVEAAARAANAHDFIAALPEAYATQVGERGIQLSGGQKQRVAIARALLKDPKILILDEATSALDAESEALVKDALDRLMQQRTSLVIAHRLSTVRSADRVLVLEGGRVVQSGTHQELARDDGVYRRLLQHQFVVA
ncbi:MAG: ABC transporter ATP-binding protein [Planctomycetota bacterium]|nr:MAG: ABC transporter ATP-binding protein [Planctomycetota bacterium]